MITMFLRTAVQGECRSSLSSPNNVEIIVMNFDVTINHVMCQNK